MEDATKHRYLGCGKSFKPTCTRKGHVETSLKYPHYRQSITPNAAEKNLFAHFGLFSMQQSRLISAQIVISGGMPAVWLSVSLGRVPGWQNANIKRRFRDDRCTAIYPLG
ncbi:hypothetical protein BJX64DRAFT_206078 [Aspergillus heterothallicus]